MDHLSFATEADRMAFLDLAKSSKHIAKFLEFSDPDIFGSKPADDLTHVKVWLSVLWESVDHGFWVLRTFAENVVGVARATEELLVVEVDDNCKWKPFFVSTENSSTTKWVAD